MEDDMSEHVQQGFVEAYRALLRSSSDVLIDEEERAQNSVEKAAAVLSLLQSTVPVADEGKLLERVLENEALEKCTSGRFLNSFWPALKGGRGLRCGRWRVRMGAVEVTSFLAVHDVQVANSKESSLPLLEELLRILIFDMAVGDTQWKVRCAAIAASTKILQISNGFLSEALWTGLALGVLAACVDPQPEVQTIATNSILQHLLPASSEHTKVIVQDLLDRFINVAITSAESSDNDFENLSGGKTLLSATKATFLLQLIPHQPAYEVQELGKLRLDRVPLVVVAASVAFADAEVKGNKLLVSSLLQLLRSLGSYYESILEMLHPMMPLYECTNLARIFKRQGAIDDHTASVLEKVRSATVLKGLVVALEASESTTAPSSAETLRSLPVTSKDKSLSNKQLDALQHIAEVMCVPSGLTQSYKDKETEANVRDFLQCGKFYLRIGLVLLKMRNWTSQQAWRKESLVLELSLSFAALASGIIETENVWADNEWLGKLSFEALVSLSKALQKEKTSSSDEGMAPVISELEISDARSLENLCIQLLPVVLPRLKENFKAGTRFINEENLAAAPKTDDLPLAIVSAHQLRWFLKQVQYPNMKPHAEMVIRTVLTALDHYTPPVKKQAMMAFTHLAKNLSPTELRWFKDAILDAVTRSLIGSEELWPVAVEMAVALVTQIEGKNPRGRWYGAIMKEMLEDLQRHRSDRLRRVVWLQSVTPQFEVMGIVLVGHFKDLLPLFYEWLHAHDEPTQQLVLANLHTIVTHTWPRIQFHALRIREELALAQKEAEKRNSSFQIFAALDELQRLLKLEVILYLRVAEDAILAPGLMTSR